MSDTERIRDLANRWVAWREATVAVLDAPLESDGLNDAERAELFAWVRRAGACGRRKFLCWNCHGLGQDGEPDMGGRDPGWVAVCDVCRGSGRDRDAIAVHVAELLVLDEKRALALLDAAESLS